MQEANKFKLGLFVISAITVLIIVVSCMGMFDQLKPKAHLVTYVAESVQGLSTGSAVKYKGVPIGNVDDISIITGTQEIRIDILIDLSKFRRKTGESFLQQKSSSRWQFYNYLQKEVSRGLTCRIEPDGITGVKYVEMDFFRDADKIPRAKRQVEIRDGIFYMPSTPSMMANLRMSVFEILASIASIDFKNISAQPLNISADELTDRFIRGDVSRNTEGSGLGLSIAKDLVQLQGGEFKLYLDGDLFKVTIEFEVK